MKNLTRKAASASAATLFAGIGLAGLINAPAAHAAARDGVCNPGEMCYYYNSGEQGSVSDFTVSVPDYGNHQPTCYDFKGPGAGKGLCIKNHAASVWNRTTKVARIYYNTGYGGSHIDIGPGERANLAGLKNNNASHELVGNATPPPNGCKTDGTNAKAPSTILVYRTNLGRVDRVNFRDYVKNVLPNEWVSSWPQQSLQSGAMAVKTYAWYWALHSSRKTANGACYDVRDDTGDQVYRPGSSVSSTATAVDATWAARMSRGGSIFPAHYCSDVGVCGAWVNGDWLSQNGSATMARNGATYRSILTRYYSGIAITP